MKKCFVRVIHMVSITELIHIVFLCRTFSVSAILYVDLRTLAGYSMQNELSGEIKRSLWLNITLTTGITRIARQWLRRFV